jgi:hypothetical protein
VIQPWWERRIDLDAEVQSLMGNSELTIFHDAPHSCIHIMLGDQEFSSAMFPLDDAIRSDLRQQAYLLNNGINEDEVKRIAEANEKLEAYNKQVKAEADNEVQNFGEWEYRHRFEGLDVTPMFVVPGRKQ